MVEVTEALIDISDELNVAGHLTVALYLACSSPVLPGSERRALCALANLLRERLAAIDKKLDTQIGATR